MSTISEKAQHVRAATQNRNHECHWPGCQVQVPPARWGCQRHWYCLPLALARIALVRDYDPKGADAIDGPDLTITPKQVRASRAALNR